MKMLYRVLPIVIIVLSACGGGKPEGGKKILVISSGKFTVSDDKKTISWEPGGQHNEQVIDLGGDKVTITVKGAPDGDKPFELSENGTWLLNLKKDTVVGSIINYGSGNRPASISAEQLDHMIDSTQKLLLGQNTNDNKGPFSIPPMTLKKITANLNANLYSPFKLIPYKVEVDENGKAPESYKFYTNTQTREDLEDLLKRMKK